VSTGIPVVLAERSEAEALYDFEISAPAAAQAELGMAAIRLGGGVALSVRADATSFWCKALGFGFDEPVTSALIEEICEFYQSERLSRAVLQLAPSVLPEDWAAICAKHNISGGATWVKVARDLTDDSAGTETPLTEDLRVGPVGPEHAQEWASVMLRGFGMSEASLSPMFGAIVGRPGWYQHGVWAGEEMIAGSTMHVYQDSAHFAGASTLPHARGRGAQGALLTARAEAARAAGCRWLVGEAGVEAPGASNSSLHNVTRVGFTVQYERRNWIWQPA
jgi:GNAT superfamily N-acetyltransferase